MVIEDLYNEITGTTIQREEKHKKYLGTEIIITGYIENIHNNNIRFFFLRDASEDLSDRTFLKGNLFFDNTIFGEKLLKLSYGDEVRVHAYFKSAEFNDYASYDKYTFELISIEKISTLNENRNKKEEERRQQQINITNEKRRKKKIENIMLGAIGGSFFFGITGCISHLVFGGVFNLITGALIGGSISAFISSWDFWLDD